MAHSYLILTGDMVPVERLVLTARVDHEDGRFVACVDGLDVQAEGESGDVAREELIQAMITWISAMDCTDSMAVALSEAGFPEINEETELHLEFVVSHIEAAADCTRDRLDNSNSREPASGR